MEIFQSENLYRVDVPITFFCFFFAVLGVKFFEHFELCLSLVLNRMPPKMKSSASTVLWPRLVLFFLVISSLLWLRQQTSSTMLVPRFGWFVAVFPPVELLTVSSVCSFFFFFFCSLCVSTTQSYRTTRPVHRVRSKVYRRLMLIFIFFPMCKERDDGENSELDFSSVLFFFFYPLSRIRPPRRKPCKTCPACLAPRLSRPVHCTTTRRVYRD